MNIEEQQYLDLINDIIKPENKRDDRTGVGTFATFGKRMEFSLLDNNFPLLTTRKIFFKGIVEELLWMLSGNTNSHILKEKNVHIWDGNSTREFLDSRGLTKNEPGDLGPIYGFQWRHFGAKYIDCHTNYDNQGIDQIANIINMLKNDRTSRRIVLSAWNPLDLDKMALPPCHILCQFDVSENKYLECQLYQRSGDIGLGVPFNIASYSLLTIILAHLSGLIPKRFIHILGNAHIYNDHVDGLKEQCERKPTPFPKLHIKNPQDIVKLEDFTFETFELTGYNPQGKINMKMSV